jgi:exoribonuclease II
MPWRSGIWPRAKSMRRKSSGLRALSSSPPTEDQLAGLGRKLLQTKTHFKFSPPSFEIYAQETVERRQEELRKAQERERLVGFGQDFLRGLWDIFCKRKNTLPQPDEDQAQRIRESAHDPHLANPDDRDSDALWKTMSQGLPEDPYLPLFLAQAWGIVPPHFNFHLARAQYDWEPDWSTAHSEAIAALQERVLATRAGTRRQHRDHRLGQHPGY